MRLDPPRLWRHSLGGDGSESGFDDDPMGEGDSADSSGSSQPIGGEEGTDMVDGSVDAIDDGVSAGGCSSTGANNWAVFLMLGLALRRMTRRKRMFSPCA